MMKIVARAGNRWICASVTDVDVAREGNESRAKKGNLSIEWGNELVNDGTNECVVIVWLKVG